MATYLQHMNPTLAAPLGVLAATLMLFPNAAAAQEIDVGGRAYIDYFYTLSSPESAEEGFHGFTYRRLYLTTDFELSEDFDGRARLEANDGTAGPRGPIPYVKDLWLRWTYSGEHSATLGVTPPPAFRVSEQVWDYRSLEQTVLDLQDIVNSRDFGLRLDGPLASEGRVRYSIMAANNSAAQPETDDYKRGYAELSYFPSQRLSFTAGLDHAGFNGAIESATRVSAFGGYTADSYRLGIEPFLYRLRPDAGEDIDALGVSLFGSVDLSDSWEIVARADFVDDERLPAGNTETFLLAGASYSPIENIRIIPNLWMFETGDDPETLGRMTVEVSF